MHAEFRELDKDGSGSNGSMWRKVGEWEYVPFTGDDFLED